MSETAPVADILSKNRLEAFSDGIFAIAATLLVLEIKVPEPHVVSGATILEALAGEWRIFLAYITSFLVIGLIWMNHHTIFHAIRVLDRLTVVLNLVLLLFVSFISFPTAMIAKYGTLPPVVMLYGLTFAATGVMFNILFAHVRRRHDMDERSGAPSWALRLSTVRGILYPVLYTIGALLAYISVTGSILVFAITPIIYLFPSPVEWQLRNRARAALDESY